MQIYPGNGAAGLRKRRMRRTRRSRARKQIPTGRWDGDGAPDSFVRTRSALTLYYGNGPGGFTSKRSLACRSAPTTGWSA